MVVALAAVVFFATGLVAGSFLGAAAFLAGAFFSALGASSFFSTFSSFFTSALGAAAFLAGAFFSALGSSVET